MALYLCPDCGSNVSSRAKACPKCGCPIDVILETAKIVSADLTPVIASQSEPEVEEVEIVPVEEVTPADFYKCNLADLSDDSSSVSGNSKVSMVVGIVSAVVIVCVVLFCLFGASKYEKMAIRLDNAIDNSLLYEVETITQEFIYEFYQIEKPEDCINVLKGLNYIVYMSTPDTSLYNERRYVKYYDQFVDCFGGSLVDSTSVYSHTYILCKTTIEEAEAQKKKEFLEKQMKESKQRLVEFEKKLKKEGPRESTKILATINNDQYRLLIFYGNMWHGEYEEYGDDINGFLYLYDADVDKLKVYKGDKGFVESQFSSVKKQYNYGSDTYRISLDDYFPLDYMDGEAVSGVDYFVNMNELGFVILNFWCGLQKLSLDSLKVEPYAADFIKNKRYAVFIDGGKRRHTFSVKDIKTDKIIANPFFKKGKETYGNYAIQVELNVEANGLVSGTFYAKNQGKKYAVEGCKLPDCTMEFFLKDSDNLIFYLWPEKQGGYKCSLYEKDDLYPEKRWETLVYKQ